MIDFCYLLFESRTKHRRYVAALTGQHLTPLSAMNESEAVRMCEHRMPCLLFVDALFIGDPGVGVRTIKRIRALENGDRPKIVMLFSFSPDDAEERQAHEAGVDLCYRETQDSVAHLPGAIQEIIVRLKLGASV